MFVCVILIARLKFEYNVQVPFFFFFSFCLFEKNILVKVNVQINPTY